MKTSDFRWLFLTALLAIVICATFEPPTTVGFSEEWSNGKYSIAGGTSVWGLAMAIVMGFLYFWLLIAPCDGTTIPMPGIARRFAAFWIDFFVAMIAIAPVLGILPTVIEWKRTGVFAWTFERTVSAPTDNFVMAVTLPLMACALVVYFALPLLRGRPSPGAGVMGYQIVVANENPMTWKRATFRTLMGFVGLGAWFLTPLFWRDRRKGQFWLDRMAET